METLQTTRISFDIVTKASEPLVIDDVTMMQLTDALDKAARSVIDLRYYPDSRYVAERHEFLGVMAVKP
jgi:hypothetical protein